MPIAPISSAVTPSKQPLFQIQNIPILLTYPTLLLSSSLIVEHTSLNSNDFVPQWTKILLSLVITPIFLGSCLSILSTIVGSLTLEYATNEIPNSEKHTHEHSHTPISAVDESTFLSLKALISGQIQLLLTLFALFSASWLLDPIRTVSLTLVLIQTTSSTMAPILLVTLFFGFDLVELIVRSGLSLNYEGLVAVNYGGWIALGYFLCFIIRGNLSDIFQGGRTKTRSKFMSKSWLKRLLFPFSLSLVSGFALLCFLKNVNISMVLITLGCGLILQLSQTQDLEIQFNTINIIVSSLLSYMLEILSFKKQFHLMLTVFEVLIICLIFFLPIESNNSTSKKQQLQKANPSLIAELITHPKTRPIFSFLLLNTTFMLVQLVYSFRSQSLGLLSDSLHMALDSTSLFIGLIATIMASKPPSRTFPFGLKKLETLAGFANGVLLVGIVFGILVEAVQRLFWPVEIQRTGELLIVAALGLVVNIVGIFAFNHGEGEHAGHSHSHSHGEHGDDNENMRGIFLHILADTLGSLGVVVSTILIQIFKTPVFDPLSSLFIAIMIFVSAVPLIKSSAKRLLLNLNDREEDQIKELLSQVVNMPGVVNYTTPRFWNESNVLEDGLTGNAASSHSVEIPKPSVTNERSRGETFSFGISNDSTLDVCHEEHEYDHHHSHTEHSHGHSHAEHSHGYSSISDDTESQFKMIGYIHIQHLDGENSTIVKKRVEKIFENAKIKCSVQVEKESDRCWCRDTLN